MSSCSLLDTYLLLSVSPQAILAYLAEGLLVPVLLFLWARPIRLKCSNCGEVFKNSDRASHHKSHGSELNLYIPVQSERRIRGLFNAIDGWVN